MGIEAIPLVLQAISGVASYVNTRNTANRQDAALATSIRNQAAKQREANTVVNQLVQKAADSNPQTYQQSTLQRYLAQVAANKANAEGGLNQVGRTSDAYRTGALDAALGIGQYGAGLSGLLSRIDAPTLQRQQEGFDRVAAANLVGQISREAKGQEYLDKLKYDRVRRNPWLDLFAGVASSAAGAGLGSGSGSGAVTGISVGPEAFSPTGPFSTGAIGGFP